MPISEQDPSRAPAPPMRPGPSRSPLTPEPTQVLGGRDQSPWDGLTGGRFSSDPTLGGFSGFEDPNQFQGFTPPTVGGGPVRSVPTSRITDFTGDFNNFSGSSTQDNSARETSLGSGSGVGSQGRSNPQSGGITASRDRTVGGYQDYADSRSQDGGNQGNSSNPSSERGDGQSGHSGGGGGLGGSTGNTSHGSESQSQQANDSGLGSLGSWF